MRVYFGYVNYSILNKSHHVIQRGCQKTQRAGQRCHQRDVAHAVVHLERDRHIGGLQPVGQAHRVALRVD